MRRGLREKRRTQHERAVWRRRAAADFMRAPIVLTLRRKRIIARDVWRAPQARKNILCKSAFRSNARVTHVRRTHQRRSPRAAHAASISEKANMFASQKRTINESQ